MFHSWSHRELRNHAIEIETVSERTYEMMWYGATENTSEPAMVMIPAAMQCKKRGKRMVVLPMNKCLTSSNSMKPAMRSWPRYRHVISRGCRVLALIGSFQLTAVLPKTTGDAAWR